MTTVQIFASVFAFSLLQISLSHSAADGCASLTCPVLDRPACSLYTGPHYKIEIVKRNYRCVDQVESHEDRSWRHSGGGKSHESHESGSNYGSRNGVYYTVLYNNTKRMLTATVWNGCKITLRVCQGTPTIFTSKPTKGPFPPMSSFPYYPPSIGPYNSSTAKTQAAFTSTTGRPVMTVLTTKRPQGAASTIRPSLITTNSTTSVQMIISTTKNIQVSMQRTKLPMVTTRTTKRTQRVTVSTKRPQVTTKTSIRIQSTWTTQSMRSVTAKASRPPSTTTRKEKTTKGQDILSEPIRLKTTPIPQPLPAEDTLDAEHVKQELRNHEDPQYGLMIGVPVGLLAITAVVLTIVCLCKRNLSSFKENKKTSEISKSLSTAYEVKGSFPILPSYENPVYGKMIQGKSIGKNWNTPEKPRKERTMESFPERSYVSEQVYEEIQNIRSNNYGTMNSAASVSKSSKGMSVNGKSLTPGNVLRIPINWYPSMKEVEYYYIN